MVDADTSGTKRIASERCLVFAAALWRRKGRWRKNALLHRPQENDSPARGPARKFPATPAPQITDDKNVLLLRGGGEKAALSKVYTKVSSSEPAAPPTDCQLACSPQVRPSAGSGGSQELLGPSDPVDFSAEAVALLAESTSAVPREHL
ncbi:unnamed protein product [Prorocentrum cordatum]|uniref:Uncharacterized protein n=1 Tax=Prorocentrum cordatum TaxID=2364126 RepID=A0ABN9VK71_9DINO|nr:unnamed protein product [Polarella glacialis]